MRGISSGTERDAAPERKLLGFDLVNKRTCPLLVFIISNSLWKPVFSNRDFD